MCMKIKLNFELENTQRIASEALRVKNALDVCNTNVMLADQDYNIIYMNASLDRMMKVAEPDLKTALPNFDADKLMGCNMDMFHKDPSHQRKILDQAKSTHSQEVKVAGRTIVITATPVFDDKKPCAPKKSSNVLNRNDWTPNARSLMKTPASGRHWIRCPPM